MIDNIIYKRNCPKCNKELLYGYKKSFNESGRKNRSCSSCSHRGINNPLFGRCGINNPRFGKNHNEETKKQMSETHIGERNPMFGKHVSDEAKEKLSKINKERYNNPGEREKMSKIGEERYKNPTMREKTSKLVKLAMHRPDVRKRHIEALHQSKWLKVKTDKGQLELIEKWNRLGFNFQLNYQIHTDADLFYVDGYDKEHNVVLEYDGKYHNRLGQKQKDLIRQNKIINILKPNKFWRYDAPNKKWKNVLEKVG